MQKFVSLPFVALGILVVHFVDHADHWKAVIDETFLFDICAFLKRWRAIDWEWLWIVGTELQAFISAAVSLAEAGSHGATFFLLFSEAGTAYEWVRFIFLELIAFFHKIGAFDVGYRWNLVLGTGGFGSAKSNHQQITVGNVVFLLQYAIFQHL